MMNKVYETLLNHKSIRKFKKKDVEEEKLNRILNAALRASSSGNMQAYSIIVTKSLSLKKKLFSPHFEQPMILEAPLFLTFCADFHRMRRWLELSEAPDNFDNFMSFMIGAIDAILASQNAAIAAESEGLGLCYMGTTLASCHEIAEILECPENVVPVVGFALGYADEEVEMRDRLPLSSIVHRDTYKDYSDDEIKEVYREREKKGMKRYQSVPRLRELIESSGVSNLAQVYTKVKYTRESHIGYSRNVIKTLKEKSFIDGL